MLEEDILMWEKDPADVWNSKMLQLPMQKIRSNINGHSAKCVNFQHAAMCFPELSENGILLPWEHAVLCRWLSRRWSEDSGTGLSDFRVEGFSQVRNVRFQLKPFHMLQSSCFVYGEQWRCLLCRHAVGSFWSSDKGSPLLAVEWLWTFYQQK